MLRFLRHRSHNGPSREALKDAQQNLQNVQNRTPEVEKVVNAMRETLEQNHFAEQLLTIMKGGIGDARR